MVAQCAGGGQGRSLILQTYADGENIPWSEVVLGAKGLAWAVVNWCGQA